jgi:hypothetical protein
MAATAHNQGALDQELGAQLAGKYMTFKLADEEYGLAILKVREIIGLMDITRGWDPLSSKWKKDLEDKLEGLGRLGPKMDKVGDEAFSLRLNDAGAEHDEKRREINEQHRARRRRVDQPLIDQDEFDGEEHAGDNAGGERAVVREQWNAAQPAPAGDDQRRDHRTDGGLRERWDVMDGELGGDLVEAPGQAQRHHDGRGQRIERAGDVMGRGRHAWEISGGWRMSYRATLYLSYPGLTRASMMTVHS